MAWNEPGGDKGNRDPWSGRGGNQGPPDLDEVVKKMQEKLGGLFGGKSKDRGPGGGGPGKLTPGPGTAGLKGIFAIAVVGLTILLIWNSVYTIEPAERGVILRFGEYKSVSGPGLHFRIPFVDMVEKVNVDEISSFRHQATMLTRDENIVDIELTVQWRIQDAADFLFQDMQPKKTIKDATETAVREMIGKSNLDFILTEGRGSIAADIRDSIQNTITSYRTGLEIISVNTQPAKPPEEVKSAFDDAIKAREDKEKLENKADAYAKEVVPKARGEAARQVADANAYRDKVIAEAQGETSRFLAVLTEYQKAPEVTRQRLYLDAVENVFGSSKKVLMDVEGGNSLMYLPLDKLIQTPMAGSESDFSSASQRGGRGAVDQSRRGVSRDVNREIDRTRRLR